jgi:hypothetical protein
MMTRLSFDSGPGRRRAAFGAALAAVVFVHAALLGWWLPAWLDNSANAQALPAIAPTLRVRSLVVMPQPPAALPPATPPPKSPQAAAPLRPPSVVLAPPQADRVEVPAPVAAESTSETAPLPPELALPVYATQMPAAGQWRYRLQRGLVVGEATLTWIPQTDGRYEARLEGRVAGVTMLDWASRGAIDAAGIAPERFALRRRGRDQQAANFQREAGKVTFSGPTHELPLLPGVQDRLSWMFQLPAIVAADPARQVSGAGITLMVVGARGGAGLWTFTVAGSETVGERPALKLVRDTERRHETRAEVWLDPARDFLPLRAVLAQIDGGPALVLDFEP